ncbi:hypothetical protein EBU99_14460 [bacterium]|nr:hypothetical protein [bacterium]
MELLRKITISTCGFDKTAINAAIAQNGGVETDLLKIAGVTTKATPGQTDKGEFVKLMGEFRAINLVSGELFNSAACILPNFVSDAIAAALEQSNEVEFALMISAKLVEAKASDKLAGLLESSGMVQTLALSSRKKAA